MSLGNFGGGSGTYDDPYLIEDFQDLEAMSLTRDLYYKLTNDIDCAGTIYSYQVVTKDFRGLDGNGYKIFNLSINTTATNSDGLGIFKKPSGAVSNLIIEDITINVNHSGCNYIGIFCGELGEEINFTNMIISNCTINLNAECSDIGILSGFYDTFNDPSKVEEVLIKNCTINGNNTLSLYNIGGLIGRVSNTYNIGYTININKCKVNGFQMLNISTDGYNIGGLIGSIDGGDIHIAECCVLNSTVIGEYDIGGLIGDLDNTVSSVSITNCFSRANIMANKDIGGIIGEINAVTNTTITNCYYAGVIIGNGYKYGLIPKAVTSITACYWDTELSTVSATAGGTGLTTAQMKDASIFTANGWDFDTIWYSGTSNEGYPYLRCFGGIAEVEIIDNAHNGSFEDTTKNSGVIALGSMNESSPVCNAYLLFKDINIPKDSVISSAKFKFTRGSSINTPATIIYLEKNSTPSLPTDLTDYNSKSLTTSNVPITIAGAVYEVDIKNLVQEIVNLSTWVGGNDMQIIWKQNAIQGNYATVDNFADHSGGIIPQLVIEFDYDGIVTPPTVTDINVYVGVGGVWKLADGVYIYNAGTWKQVDSVGAYNGGTWKTS